MSSRPLPLFRLGPYAVEREIGRGGMAVVYEGVHVEDGRRVAIKVVSEGIRKSPTAVARFTREARVLSGLRHPHIVSATGLETWEGRSYFVMERLEGPTLAAHLEARGGEPLTAEEVAEIFLPITAAVAAAHAHGVVHRDLKPSNILLAQRGAGAPRHPTVLDFGVASSRDAVAEALTRTDAVLGTVSYLSPEETRGARYATAQSDQYALGVMLYECATGRLPFRGKNAYETMMAIVAGAPRRPRDLHASLPEAFEAIVLRAMHADPGRRFRSVRDLGRALLDLADEGVSERWRGELGGAGGPASSARGGETGSVDLASAALRAGGSFGRYDLLELLGDGALGELYCARDTLLHRRVALRVLRLSDASDEPSRRDASAQMLHEARAAAAIAHPNVIETYDVGEVDGVPFLAMELLPGKTLRALIGDDTIPITERIQWLARLARGLEAAHALGVVHRDVKPESVIVRDDGRVTLLDFGLARRAVANAPPGTLTEEGLVVGTPSYMAPEQMRGEAVDGRADQFAWGVLAYELLTGELPWGGETDPLKLAARVLTGEVPSARGRNPEIPAAADAVIARALRKTAGSRFERMGEVAEALEAYATAGRAKPEAGAHATPRSEKAQTPVLWRRGAVLVVAALAACVAAAPLLLPRRVGVARRIPDASAVPVTESKLSPNAEATAAYRAGVKAIRDASLDTASRELDRAIELDPGFALAHLRRALLALEGITNQVRADLLAARNGREDLGTYDRALLEAAQPWTSVPLDMRDLENHERAAVEQYPADAELELFLGMQLSYADGLSAIDGALRKDPGLPIAWCRKARALVERGDLPGANAAYDQCLALSPSATACLEDLSELQAGAGMCEEMAATTRRLISVTPDVPHTYVLLAEALFSLGRPVEQVTYALRQSSRRHTPDLRSVDLGREADLAILTGDFEGALRDLREIDKEVASSSEEGAHFFSSYEEMLVNLEIGRHAEARALATRYLSRRPAWQTNDQGLEPTIYEYAVQGAAGGIAAPELRLLREGWSARAEERAQRLGKIDPEDQSARWSAGHALFVTTRAEATAALEVRPAIPMLVDSRLAYVEEPIGRTYLLAGKLDDAIAVLERVSDSCLVFDLLQPIFSTWALFDLGEALEAKGNAADACIDYRRVIERWGSAHPPSRTATKAKRRLQALQCAQ